MGFMTLPSLFHKPEIRFARLVFAFTHRFKRETETAHRSMECFMAAPEGPRADTSKMVEKNSSLLPVAERPTGKCDVAVVG
jgi:hypothetical protein